MIQKSFVMMKPDAVQRRLMGKILSRFEENFWVYALSFFDSYWVLEGSGCNYSSEVVNIYFQFDEVGISWDSYAGPAWYARRK